MLASASGLLGLWVHLLLRCFCIIFQLEHLADKLVVLIFSGQQNIVECPPLICVT